MPRRSTVGLWLALSMAAASACAHADKRKLKRASRSLGKAIGRADAAQIRTRVAPGLRPILDVRALAAGPRGKAWQKALGKPKQVRPEALVFLGPEHPVRVVWTQKGWRFAEDPTDLYAQSTPRQALRSLVRASRAKRWDVLIELAPRRYRLGLAQRDLENAWTEGEQAEALAEARDRLAAHLADPIVADAHEAVLDMGGGHVARLEREGPRWVVVDF